MKIKTRQIVLSAMIAGLYVVLTLPNLTLSYGPVQFRFSEALVALPILFPEAILGVSLGCLISNAMSPFWMYDLPIGTLATVLAAILTRLLRKRKLVALLPPVIFNALLVPCIFLLAKDFTYAYWLNALMILGSEAAIVYGIGFPIVVVLDKRFKIVKK